MGNKYGSFYDKVYFEEQKENSKKTADDQVTNKVDYTDDDDRQNSNAQATAALEQSYPRINPENL